MRERNGHAMPMRCQKVRYSGLFGQSAEPCYGLSVPENGYTNQGVPMSNSVLTKAQAQALKAPTKPKATATPKVTDVNKAIAEGAAHVLATVDCMILFDKRTDLATLDLLYGVDGGTGSLRVAEAWTKATGQKLTKLGTKAMVTEYNKLQSLSAVLQRFGSVRPPRLSSWSAIVKATTLTDAELDSLEGETIDQEMVQSLKPAGKAKAKLKSQELSGSPAAIDWNSAEAQADLTGQMIAFTIALKDPRCSVHADQAKALRNAIAMLATATK